MSEKWEAEPLKFVEVHDTVVRFEQVGPELRAYLADGSYYVVGFSDTGKMVVHLGRDLLNS